MIHGLGIYQIINLLKAQISQIGLYIALDLMEYSMQMILMLLISKQKKMLKMVLIDGIRFKHIAINKCSLIVLITPGCANSVVLKTAQILGL
jgi:hypothetical protein